MKFYAINGSARKNCNTAKLLDKSLEGIKSINPEAEVERIDLFDIPFNGCKSCFACKKINGRHYGKCVYKDEFKPILNKISESDGIILGSPIYFHDVTGNMRCFLERFMFPSLNYNDMTKSNAKNRMPLALVYTFGMPEENFPNSDTETTLNAIEHFLELLYSKPEVLYSFDTYQFEDYSKYIMDESIEKHKREVRENKFPKDLEDAFKLGQGIAKKANE